MRLSDNGAAFIGAVCVRAEFFTEGIEKSGIVG